MPAPHKARPKGAELQAFLWRDYYRVEHYTIQARLEENSRLLTCRAALALEYIQGGFDRIDLAFGSSLADVDSIKRGTSHLEFQYYQKGQRMPAPDYPFIELALDSLSISLGKTAVSGEKDTLDIFFKTNLVNPYPKDSTFYGEISRRSLFSSYGYWHPALPEARWSAAVYDTYLDLPSSYIVAGMGEIISQTDTVGRRITHLHADGPAARGVYPFAAGEYKEFEGQYRDIAVKILLFPEHEHLGHEMLSFTLEMFSWLEGLYGVNYPLPALQFVERDKNQVPNTSAPGIIFLDSTVVSRWESQSSDGSVESTSREVMLHEMAHQWWGHILMTESDFWIQEGFAVLAQIYYLDRYQGKEVSDERIKRLRQLYLNFAGFIEFKNDTIPFNTSTAMYDLYYKAPWILCDLREKLSSSLFENIMRTFLAENSFLVVNTRDWQALCERLSGRNLSGYFTEWFYRPGFPRLYVRWEYQPVSSRSGVFHNVMVTVNQRESVFTLDADFVIYLKNSEVVREVKTISGESFQINFQVGGPPDSVLVDPEEKLLAQINYPVRGQVSFFGDTPNSELPYPVSFYIDSLLALDKLSLIYQVDSGEAREVVGDPAGLSSGSGTLEIPAQPAGSLIEYYLQVLDKNGVINYLPDGAPEKKYSFHITRPPDSPDNLLTSCNTDYSLLPGIGIGYTLLYDLKDQRVVGKIYGVTGKKTSWSQDGTLAMIFDIYKNKLYLIDIFKFRLISVFDPADKFPDFFSLDFESRPIITQDNRFALIPISLYTTDRTSTRKKLLRIGLDNGQMKLTSGLSDSYTPEGEPLFLPERRKIAICAFLDTAGRGNSGTKLLLVDPQANQIVQTIPLFNDWITAFQVDSSESRFFLQAYKSVQILSGNPLQLELKKDYLCYDPKAPPPFDKYSQNLSFTIQVPINKSGVMVYENTYQYTCFDNMIYWDTRDRNEPLHDIVLSDVFPYSQYKGRSDYPYLKPGFTASSDSRLLWITANPLFAGDSLSQGLLQFDFNTRSFLEPIPVTGLRNGELLGYISAYQKPAHFISPMRGDINGDSVYNIFDLIAFLKAWGSGPPNADTRPEMDLDGSGKIDLLDLVELLKILAK